jgi:nicotinamidase-related amidase
VDTVVVTGCITSGCVRADVIDGAAAVGAIERWRCANDKT